MERRFGIDANCLKGVSAKDALPLIAKAGFKSFFTDVYTPAAVAEVKEIADKLGLAYTFIHAPFDKVNTFWLEGDAYRDLYDRIKIAIDAASQSEVPVVILHLSSGWTPPAISDVGLKRFDELVEYAESKNVKVAFENLRVVGNVSYFVERYENRDSVGFCYDNGHEHCYTKYVTWLDIFRERTLCTHIHDNLGRGKEKVGEPDLHLLPFDGTADYAKMMRKLDEYGYEGDLTLEVFNSTSPEYLKMSHEEFLNTCYERLVKISKM
ncbi:MAG: sugar phosphate isomerase/epimerase [Clostridia bacterium]|nr:sugar phosphate isomerase/epimerase [Clostridia bacterium]